MVRKQPPSLYDHCAQTLSDKLWKFSKEHCFDCEFCSLCNTEDCAAFNSVRDMITLPENLIQSVYIKIYKMFKSYCARNFESKRKNLLFLLLSLLKVEQTSLKIRFSFESGTDMPCVLKFGKNIDTLSVQEYSAEVIGFEPVTVWKNLLRNTNHIQVLILNYESFNQDVLEVIGQECHQLKVLDGLIITDGVTLTRGGHGVTPNSVQKLFFRSDGTRNKCCDTIQFINIITTDQRSVEHSEIDAMVVLLFQNLPSLESLGQNLDFDTYLDTIHLGSRPSQKTNMKEIALSKLTNNHVEVMSTFCPKVQILRTGSSEPGALQKLSSFENVQELHIVGLHDPTDMFSEVVSTQWSTLMHLTLYSYAEINLNALINQCPLLTELFAATCTVTSWNKVSYFNCLEKVTLRLSIHNSSDTTWFGSFANTIKYLRVSCENGFNPSTCQILLQIPFPVLEYLNVEPFTYDHQFYAEVITKFPKLRFCEMYATGFNVARTRQIQQMRQFIMKNNLECQLHGGYQYGINEGII